MKNRSYKFTIAALGILLGFGAPLGSIFFRGLQAGPFNLNWIGQELHSHSFYYSYMALTTPIIFALFGLFLGHFIDQFFSQKAHLEELNSQLKVQSIMDDLTGKYNYRHLQIEMEREIERARRYKHTLAGIMIDVDDFKKFNDKFGHLAGDTVLRQVADVFEVSIRKIDILGRYGGDEFLIILPEATADTATVVAQRIKKNIEEHSFQFKTKSLKVAVSIGLYFFQDLMDVDKNQFIEKIDAALLKAKSQGKNRVVSASD